MIELEGGSLRADRYEWNDMGPRNNGRKYMGHWGVNNLYKWSFFSLFRTSRSPTLLNQDLFNFISPRNKKG